jgi:tRNA-specific 2-thiouridylase
MLKDVNWIGDEPVNGGLSARERLHVRVRSSQDPLPALLSLKGRTAVVVLDDGEFGVAPGQACVFYSSEPNARVLGGGWIAATSADVHEAISGSLSRAETLHALARAPVAAGPAD